MLINLPKPLWYLTIVLDSIKTCPYKPVQDVELKWVWCTGSWMASPSPPAGSLDTQALLWFYEDQITSRNPSHSEPTPAMAT